MAMCMIAAATKHNSHHASAPAATVALYNGAMYIIAIGWLYVTVLMALTETSVVAGVLSFVFYGLAPTALLLWLFARPARRKNSAMKTPPDQDRPGH
jgi:biotin transporter BioY